MRDRYEEGWSDGFDAASEAAPALAKVALADQEEPTPAEIDPETLTEDELAFYEAGYNTGYDDAEDDRLSACHVSISEYSDAAYEDGYKDGVGESRRLWRVSDVDDTNYDR